MSLAAPSGSNTFIPTHEATDGMVIGYSRNRDKFAINRYSALKPVTQTAGKFLYLDPSVNARTADAAGSDSVWADGADSPSGERNQARFEFQNYRTTRHRDAVITGRKAIEQASWSVEDSNGRLIAQKHMTQRTRYALNVLANAPWGSNTADAATLCGVGKHLGNGDETSPNIKAAFLQIGLAINLATYGVINPEDLVCVLSPEAAVKMSRSPEVQKAFIQSQFALNQLQGAPNLNQKWGLPADLYGVPLVVEDCVLENSKRFSTPTPTRALSDSIMYFLAVPGNTQVVQADDSHNNDYAPVIHTVCMFAYEEFTVEAWDEPKHRRVEATVTSDYEVQVIAPITGFKLTAAFGV